MLLVPALVTSMVVTGWLSWRKGAGKQEFATSTHPVRNKVKGSHHAYRVWFLRPTILLEGATLAAIISLAVLIKRLGRPIGTASLTDPASNLFAELLNTITYQTTVYFTWPDTIKFLSRQFGVPHHFWLTIATIAGLIISLTYWLTQTRSPTSNHQSANPQPPTSSLSFTSFLWLTFGLIILEMVSLLEPFRRNPRYMVMVLPFFYLIAATAIFHIPVLVHTILGIARPYPEQSLRDGSRLRDKVLRFITTPKTQTILAIALLILFTTVGFNDLRIALLTPEPAYEEAFAHIQAEWQPGDTLLTMNTPAAGLYLGQASGFTVQTGADQFLLNADTAPIDRWLGAPWLGTMADFNAALNSSPRTWFVIDTIRQPVYFRGDWQAVVNTQMDQVWTKGNAIIYRTRPDRSPLPAQPDTLINATLGDSIQLMGYTLQLSDSQSSTSNHKLLITTDHLPSSKLQLTLFWQPLARPSTDYTTFVHFRTSDGATLAQSDSQPLAGVYPTSRWQPAETIIDPITLPLPEDLPAGTYTLFVGLYRLDTLERLPVANDTSGENAIVLAEVRLP
jgi:hypothetical protein